MPAGRNDDELAPVNLVGHRRRHGRRRQINVFQSSFPVSISKARNFSSDVAPMKD